MFGSSRRREIESRNSATPKKWCARAVTPASQREQAKLPPSYPDMRRASSKNKRCCCLALTLCENVRGLNGVCRTGTLRTLKTLRTHVSGRVINNMRRRRQEVRNLFSPSAPSVTQVPPLIVLRCFCRCIVCAPLGRACDHLLHDLIREAFDLAFVHQGRQRRWCQQCLQQRRW